MRPHWAVALAISLMSIPAAADSEQHNLSDTAVLELSGSAQGKFWVPNVVMTGRDTNNNLCLGYVNAPTPDHVIELDKDFSQVKIQVKSGRDSTLVIQGPDKGKIRCNDTSINRRGRDNPDAGMSGKQWKEGTYNVWVGTFEAGQKLTYTLDVEVTR